MSEFVVTTVIVIPIGSSQPMAAVTAPPTGDAGSKTYLRETLPPELGEPACLYSL